MLTKNKKRGKSDRTVLFALILLIITLAVTGFFVFSNWKINQKRVELTAKIESLQKEIQAAEERNAQLKASVNQTQSQEYLEKVAREDLNYKKTGEDVVVVKQSASATEETVAPEKNLWQKILDKFNF